MHESAHIADAAEQIPAGFFVLDQNTRILCCNRFIVEHSGRSEASLLGLALHEAFPEVDNPNWRAMLEKVWTTGNPLQTVWHDQPYLILLDRLRGVPMLQASLLYRFEHEGQHLFGLAIFDNSRAAKNNPVLEEALLALKNKHIELNALSEQLKMANRQLLQSEKMAAIGQLAAGVAHEINNPVGFVASNLKTLVGYVRQLLELVDQMNEWGGTELQQLKQRYDYDFIREDINGLLAESAEGVDRVRKIIGALRDFSHTSDETFTQADLHEGIESTLKVVNNEIKYKADVVREFGQLPLIECIAAQINQVVMNLLVNAAHAIEEFGRIVIRTGVEGDQAFIEIEDSGCGIPAELQQQIFDPFFTTKPVGKGTGLGLALSFNIIEKHNGYISLRSEPGKGSCFRINLPLIQPHARTRSSP
jgi:two-component system NtrC family sensor kinase